MIGFWSPNVLGNVSQAVEITVPMIMTGHFDPSNKTVKQRKTLCCAQMILKSLAGAVIKRWTLFDCLKGSEGEDAIFFFHLMFGYGPTEIFLFVAST